jgi:hypothetical protein
MWAMARMSCVVSETSCARRRLIRVVEDFSSASMKFLSKLLLCGFLVFCVSGCDTISGVRRSVTVLKLPPPCLVTAALRAVPGVTSVEHRSVGASSAWSLYEGVIRDPGCEQFLYHTDSLSGVAATRQSEDGTQSIELYRIWINQIPSRKVFDDTRTLMDVVYSSLRQHSPDLPPSIQTKETLFREPKQ